MQTSEHGLAEYSYRDKYIFQLYIPIVGNNFFFHSMRSLYKFQEEPNSLLSKYNWKINCSKIWPWLVEIMKYLLMTANVRTCNSQLCLEIYRLVQDKYLYTHNFPRSKFKISKFSSPPATTDASTTQYPADTLTEGTVISNSSTESNASSSPNNKRKDLGHGNR